MLEERIRREDSEVCSDERGREIWIGALEYDGTVCLCVDCNNASGEISFDLEGKNEERKRRKRKEKEREGKSKKMEEKEEEEEEEEINFSVWCKHRRQN